MQPKSPQDLIEEGVGMIYIGLYQLRASGNIQEEYDSMRALITMLMRDCSHIRENHKGIIV